jgi:hypothetical protein
MKEIVSSGKHVRFSRAEQESARNLGIDLTSVRTLDQYSRAIARLVRILEADRPELLEKIARALGVKGDVRVIEVASDAWKGSVT